MIKNDEGYFSAPSSLLNNENDEASSLRAIYTIDFSSNTSNKGMYDAFYTRWGRDASGDAKWTFDTKNHTAILIF